MNANCVILLQTSYQGFALDPTMEWSPPGFLGYSLQMKIPVGAGTARYKADCKDWAISKARLLAYFVLS